jgi:hypothetical protein
MANYINNLISDILTEKTSKFEAIKYINALVENETLEFFIEEFKEEYDNVAYKFIVSFSQKQKNTVFNFMESDLDFLFENNICVDDIKAMKKYIILCDNVSYYIEGTKTEIAIPNDIEISDYERNEILNETPQQAFAKVSLIGNYFIAFNWIPIYKNFYNTYDSKQKKQLNHLINFYTEIEKKAGNVKVLKAIYQFLLSKQYTISSKLNNFEIDLSNTTATEKIIYLQKLGVIDFLRKKQPFNTSINSLAIILSAITGVNPETKHIQSMLNPIISKEAGQKNNPLNSKNAVLKVENQLINIGFNLNETI